MPKHNFPTNSPNTLEEAGHNERDMFSYRTNPLDSGFDKRVADTETHSILTGDVKTSIDINTAMNMTRSAGFHVGEQYDTVSTADVNGTKLLQYDLAGICQFQVELDVDGTNFTITKRICEFFLLQENGDKLLQETGDALKTQGLVP